MSDSNELVNEEARIDRGRLLKAAAGLAAGGAVAGGTAQTAAAALSQGRRGGTMQVAFSDGSARDSLDPHTTFNILGSGVNQALHEPLVAVDQFWNPGPLLARSFDANAKLTRWTFVLRDAEFHNGRPLTAKDVAYTLRRILTPKVASPIYGALSASLAPSGIKVLDRRTIQLNLKRPDAFLPITLASRHSSIIPAGTTELKGVGTGPFRVRSWSPGRSFHLERNPDYWVNGVPFLDGVRGVVISEQSTKLQAVLSGSAHLGDPIDYDSAKQVTQSNNAKVLRARNGVNYRICVDSSVEPFNDNRVRQALKLVTQRTQVTDLVLQGFGAVTHDVPVLPSDPTFPPNGARARNVAQARQLLSQAGHPNGIDMTLYTSEAYAGMVDLAVVYARQAADAGIRVDVQQAPAATYWTDYYFVKPAFVVYWITRHPYASLSLGFLGTATSSNDSKMRDARFDQIMAQIGRTKDEKKQRALFRQAMSRVQNNSGSIIPSFGDSLWVAKKNVQGMKFDLIRLVDWRTAYLA